MHVPGSSSYIVFGHENLFFRTHVKKGRSNCWKSGRKVWKRIESWLFFVRGVPFHFSIVSPGQTCNFCYLAFSLRQKPFRVLEKRSELATPGFALYRPLFFSVSVYINIYFYKLWNNEYLNFNYFIKVF